MDITDPIIAQSGRVVGLWKRSDAYCHKGFREHVTPSPKSLRRHSQSEPETQAAKSFLAGVPFPAPGCVQTFRNRVRVARAERARMVCHVWCVRALDGRLSVLVWHNSS